MTLQSNSFLYVSFISCCDFSRKFKKHSQKTFQESGRELHCMVYLLLSYAKARCPKQTFSLCWCDMTLYVKHYHHSVEDKSQCSLGQNKRKIRLSYGEQQNKFKLTETLLPCCLLVYGDNIWQHKESWCCFLSCYSVTPRAIFTTMQGPVLCVILCEQWQTLFETNMLVVRLDKVAGVWKYIILLHCLGEKDVSYSNQIAWCRSTKAPAPTYMFTNFFHFSSFVFTFSEYFFNELHSSVPKM